MLQYKTIGGQPRDAPWAGDYSANDATFRICSRSRPLLPTDRRTFGIDVWRPRHTCMFRRPARPVKLPGTYRFETVTQASSPRAAPLPNHQPVRAGPPYS